MVKEIKLSQGKYAIVDDDWYEMLSLVSWYYHDRGYARTGSKRDGIIVNEFMHRVIMHTPKGMQTDHINGDKLDNRAENLRICTNSQNQQSTNKGFGSSKHRGVFWYKRYQKWRTEIMLNGKVTFLGYFKLEADAAKAYNEAAKELHGEFASLNDV